MHSETRQANSSKGRKPFVSLWVVLVVATLLFMVFAVIGALFPHLIHVAAHAPWVGAFYIAGRFPWIAFIVLYLIVTTGAVLCICALPHLFRR